MFNSTPTQLIQTLNRLCVEPGALDSTPEVKEVLKSIFNNKLLYEHGIPVDDAGNDVLDCCEDCNEWLEEGYWIDNRGAQYCSINCMLLKKLKKSLKALEVNHGTY